MSDDEIFTRLAVAEAVAKMDEDAMKKAQKGTGKGDNFGR